MLIRLETDARNIEKKPQVMEPSTPSAKGTAPSNCLQELLGLEFLYHPRRMASRAPPFYVSRRRQLLFARPPAAVITKEYLMLRQLLLARKFGPPPLLYSRSLHTRSGGSLSLRTDDPVSNRTDYDPDLLGDLEEDPVSIKQSIHGESSQSNISANQSSQGAVMMKTLDYQFTGMAAIFDQHKLAVTRVQFAHNHKYLFCCGSQDGRISVCTVGQPLEQKFSLVGHENGVTDLQWSTNNDMILSVSLDKSIRLWDMKNGDTLRTIRESSEVLCCAFCPVNNNFFAVGTQKGEIRVYNLSTGKPVSNSSILALSSVRALTFETHGRLLFAGDDLGTLHIYDFSSITGRLTRVSKTPVSNDRAITSLSFVNTYFKRRHEPLLLVNSKDQSLRILTLTNVSTGIVKERNYFPNHQLFYDLKSTFCPLIAVNLSRCVVTGSEDMSVHIFDIGTRKLVNQLKGHSAPVLSVCWNYDESILGTADATGVVIFWKRQAS